MKIAIVSPDITNLGGISRCVVVLIEALNKKGIVPDYYGIYSDTKKVQKNFNRKIEYNFKKILWWKRARLYSSLMKNLQLLFTDYDYIFDFTNTLPFSSNKGRYSFYLLYPEFLTSRGKYNKGWWKIYYFPQKIIAYLRRNSFKNSKMDITCVSKDTSDIIYNLFKKRYPVLYPPANINDFKNNIKKKSGVVSLGGLTHEKNQMEQLRIAGHFPKTQFNICGNAKRNPTYFSKLKNEAKNFKNVTLCPNFPFDKLKKKLIHSEVFLNSGRNDPFCMALIEGIAAGCIPLIHDSGGIIEIVPFTELKYKTEKEAIEKLKKILNLSEKKKKELRNKLEKYIQQFGEEQFIKKLFSDMEKKIGKLK